MYLIVFAPVRKTKWISERELPMLTKIILNAGLDAEIIKPTGLLKAPAVIIEANVQFCGGFINFKDFHQKRKASSGFCRLNQ